MPFSELCSSSRQARRSKGVETHITMCRKRMKASCRVYLVGALARAGIWPLAGFWSKDEILAESLSLQPTVYWLLTIAAFFTAFYMGRQVLMVFFGVPR